MKVIHIGELSHLLNEWSEDIEGHLRDEVLILNTNGARIIGQVKFVKPPKEYVEEICYKVYKRP